MSAVIKLKSKQYNIEIGEIVKVDKIKYNKSQIVNITDAISYSKESGKIRKVNVIALIINHGEENKNIVFKKKRRKNYKRKMGESKKITFIKIKRII